MSDKLDVVIVGGGETHPSIVNLLRLAPCIQARTKYSTTGHHVQPALAPRQTTRKQRVHHNRARRGTGDSHQ